MNLLLLICFILISGETTNTPVLSKNFRANKQNRLYYAKQMRKFFNQNRAKRLLSKKNNLRCPGKTKYCLTKQFTAIVQNKVEK